MKSIKLLNIIKENDIIQKQFSDVIEWKKNKNGSMIDWVVISKNKWDEKIAKNFQTSRGYDPAGYWFGQFNSTKNTDGTYTSKWKSYSSAG